MKRFKEDFTAFGSAMKGLDELNKFRGAGAYESDLDRLVKASSAPAKSLEDFGVAKSTGFGEIYERQKSIENLSLAKPFERDNVASAMAKMAEDVSRATSLGDAAASTMAKSLEEISLAESVGGSIGSAMAKRLEDISIAKLGGDNIALEMAKSLEEISLAKSAGGSIGSAMAKPFDDIGIAKSLSDDRVSSAMESIASNVRMAGAASDYARFALPLHEDLAKITADVYASNRFPEMQQLFLSAAETLKSAWLEINNPLESAQGLAALLDVGKSLQGSPFGTDASEALRDVLGDWRNSIEFSAQMLDADARRAIYYDRGLAPSLAALPQLSFGEILNATHVSIPISVKEAKSPSSSDQSEVVPLATNRMEEKSDTEGASSPSADGPSLEMLRCHKLFHMLEKKLRRFVESTLEAAFGPKWIKQQVPGDVLVQWRERQKKAEEAGEAGRKTIEFAEMGDYPKIICKGDNWKFFEGAFQRKEFVQECFNRLIPSRHAFAHHRDLSVEDTLFIWVETQRLCKAMGSPIEGFSELSRSSIF
jgi:hypothetical protein